jgi:hypothetical protein
MRLKMPSTKRPNQKRPGANKFNRHSAKKSNFPPNDEINNNNNQSKGKDEQQAFESEGRGEAESDLLAC